MKKIILSAIFFFAFLGFISAQTTPANATAKKATATGKTVKHTKTTTVDSTKSTVLKKDGTPDMRVKENKMAAKKSTAAGPLKKDGTPDERFKANKKK